MKNLNLIKHELNQYYGCIQPFHGMNKNSIYTDGIKHLLEEAECYWLYDIIQFEIYDLLRRKNVLDVFYFTISVKKDSDVAELFLRDYKKDVIWAKKIDYTDFPYGELEFVVGWDGERLTTCLHSEN